MADNPLDAILPDIDVFETGLPFPHDPADEWETLELRRRWHDALRSLRAVAEQAIGQYTKVAGLTGDRFEYRPGGGSLSYQAIQAETNLVGFARVLDGAVHRQSWLRNGNPSDREMVMLRTLAALHDQTDANPDQCPCESDHCVLTERWVPDHLRRNGPPAPDGESF